MQSTSIGSPFTSSKCNWIFSLLSMWIYLSKMEFQSFNYNKETENPFIVSDCQISCTKYVSQVNIP